MSHMRKERPQRFETHYLTAGGVLMVIADDFIVLVRLRDGFCRQFSYEQLGF